MQPGHRQTVMQPGQGYGTHLLKPSHQQHSCLDGEPAHVVVCALRLFAERLADVEAWHVQQAGADTQLGKGSSCLCAGGFHDGVPAQGGAWGQPPNCIIYCCPSSDKRGSAEDTGMPP